MTPTIDLDQTTPLLSLWTEPLSTITTKLNDCFKNE